MYLHAHQRYKNITTTTKELKGRAMSKGTHFRLPCSIHVHVYATQQYTHRLKTHESSVVCTLMEFSKREVEGRVATWFCSGNKGRSFSHVPFIAYSNM